MNEKFYIKYQVSLFYKAAFLNFETTVFVWTSLQYQVCRYLRCLILDDLLLYAGYVFTAQDFPSN